LELDIDKNGNVLGVLTMEDLEKSNISNHEIACGAFCFNANWLRKNILKIKRNPKSKEYHLPDLIYIGARKKEYIKTFSLKNKNEWLSINTPEELDIANNKFKKLRK
jgi:bifunctional N-acetylglucosamine-1-phosphate-uridyltransferase/glucosamine-1-phosphate-acetyltransferase GlmU-like protein